MSRRILPPIGVLLLAVGFVWFFHGVGLLEDGIMSDQPLWAVLGAGMIASGIGVLGRARASSRG
jgi:hypothetical protein